MKKGFGLIDILIIIGLISLTLLIWQRCFGIDPLKESFKKLIKQTEEKKDGFEEKKETPVSEEEAEIPKLEGEEEKQKEKTSTTTQEARTPKNPTIPPEEEEKKEEEKEEEEETTCPNGIYENNTYYYSISCPAGWPLRVRREENVSIGTVPPKNGQGAITIEISQEDINKEINSIKAEAQKYPGMINIEEEQITMDGVSGNKLTLENTIAKIKNVLIVLEKNGIGYIIKYPHESSEFVAQAEDTLKTFKFTK